jgi:hypothetical protein
MRLFVAKSNFSGSLIRRPAHSGIVWLARDRLNRFHHDETFSLGRVVAAGRQHSAFLQGGLVVGS